MKADVVSITVVFVISSDEDVVPVAPVGVLRDQESASVAAVLDSISSVAAGVVERELAVLMAHPYGRVLLLVVLPLLLEALVVAFDDTALDAGAVSVMVGAGELVAGVVGADSGP